MMMPEILFLVGYGCPYKKVHPRYIVHKHANILSAHRPLSGHQTIFAYIMAQNGTCPFSDNGIVSHGHRTMYNFQSGCTTHSLRDSARNLTHPPFNQITNFELKGSDRSP